MQNVHYVGILKLTRNVMTTEKYIDNTRDIYQPISGISSAAVFFQHFKYLSSTSFTKVIAMINYNV